MRTFVFNGIWNVSIILYSNPTHANTHTYSPTHTGKNKKKLNSIYNVTSLKEFHQIKFPWMKKLLCKSSGESEKIKIM